jgi:hypothetical protein
MTAEEYGLEHAVVRVPKQELLLISKALSELLNAIDPREFRARFRASRDQMQQFYDEFEGILSRMR